MPAKNIIIRKQIEGAIYELLPKTLISQVYDDNNVQLATLISDISAAIATKAANTDLQALKTQFDNLIKDAPEAYDTLLEISSWIGTHKSEYDALVGLISTKVTAEAGKGLSSNDFTDAYKKKLDEIYTKAQLDTKLGEITTAASALTTRVTAVENDVTTLKGDKTVAGSVDKKINDALTPISTKVNANETAIAAINDPTTGIKAAAAADATTKANKALADAKTYADTKVSGTAKIYASTTEPEGLTENDLWLAIQEAAPAV